MIDYQRLFHVGVRTPDLEASMVELGPSLAVTWAEVREMEAQPVWTPERGSHQPALRFVYSCEGPQHIELVEGEAGSIWDGRNDPGVHHVGLWVDDVAAEVERTLAAGWSLVAANAAPDEGYGHFAYLAPPTGLIVEVVSSVIEPAFEAWWAAGPAGF